MLPFEEINVLHSPFFQAIAQISKLQLDIDSLESQKYNILSSIDHEVINDIKNNNDSSKKGSDFRVTHTCLFIKLLITIMNEAFEPVKIRKCVERIRELLCFASYALRNIYECLDLNDNWRPFADISAYSGIVMCAPSAAHPYETNLNAYQARFIQTFDKSFDSRGIENLNIAFVNRYVQFLTPDQTYENWNEKLSKFDVSEKCRVNMFSDCIHFCSETLQGIVKHLEEKHTKNLMSFKRNVSQVAAFPGFYTVIGILNLPEILKMPELNTIMENHAAFTNAMHSLQDGQYNIRHRLMDDMMKLKLVERSEHVITDVESSMSPVHSLSPIAQTLPLNSGNAEVSLSPVASPSSNSSDKGLVKSSVSVKRKAEEPVLSVFQETMNNLIKESKEHRKRSIPVLGKLLSNPKIESVPSKLLLGACVLDKVNHNRYISIQLEACNNSACNVLDQSLTEYIASSSTTGKTLAEAIVFKLTSAQCNGTVMFGITMALKQHDVLLILDEPISTYINSLCNEIIANSSSRLKRIDCIRDKSDGLIGIPSNWVYISTQEGSESVQEKRYSNEDALVAVFEKYTSLLFVDSELEFSIIEEVMLAMTVCTETVILRPGFSTCQAFVAEKVSFTFRLNHCKFFFSSCVQTFINYNVVMCIAPDGMILQHIIGILLAEQSAHMPELVIVPKEPIDTRKILSSMKYEITLCGSFIIGTNRKEQEIDDLYTSVPFDFISSVQDYLSSNSNIRNYFRKFDKVLLAGFNPNAMKLISTYSENIDIYHLPEYLRLLFFQCAARGIHCSDVSNIPENLIKTAGESLNEPQGKIQRVLDYSDEADFLVQTFPITYTHIFSEYGDTKKSAQISLDRMTDIISNKPIVVPTLELGLSFSHSTKTRKNCIILSVFAWQYFEKDQFPSEFLHNLYEFEVLLVVHFSSHFSLLEISDKGGIITHYDSCPGTHEKETILPVATGTY